MTYAPLTLTKLAAYWRSEGGVNLGIVGDAAHQKRASYHNGQDVIVAAGRTALDDYSIRLVRDREPHLSNAAAAIDLGKLGGTLQGLQGFSTWLVGQCRGHAPGTRDIREVIWSPDGVAVRRWDMPTGRIYTGGTGTGQGDDSHRWHTHISYFRDAEQSDKVAVFAAYPAFTSPPDTGTEDPMGLSLKLAATVDATTPWVSFATARIKGAGHYAIRVSDMVGTALADGHDLGVVQYGALTKPLEEQLGKPAVAGDRTNVVVTNINGQSHVVLRSDVTATTLAAPDTKHEVGLAIDGQIVHVREV